MYNNFEEKKDIIQKDMICIGRDRFGATNYLLGSD